MIWIVALLFWFTPFAICYVGACVGDRKIYSLNPLRWDTNSQMAAAMWTVGVILVITTVTVLLLARG